MWCDTSVVCGLELEEWMGERGQALKIKTAAGAFRIGRLIGKSRLKILFCVVLN
jgi:hypothetical protein